MAEITIAAVESRMTRETEWQRLEAERASSVDPITKLTRQYTRGLMTKREYYEEMYRTLEDMGAPAYIS